MVGTLATKAHRPDMLAVSWQGEAERLLQQVRDFVGGLLAVGQAHKESDSESSDSAWQRSCRESVCKASGALHCVIKRRFLSPQLEDPVPINSKPLDLNRPTTV